MLAFVLCLQMMEFYERVSGARMHAAYIRPGGVAQVTKQFMAEALSRKKFTFLLFV